MDRGQRIAQAAKDHAGCSDAVHVGVYADVVVRPADRVPRLLPYYLSNTSKTFSTCALFATGCLRLAGCTEDEVTATYFPGGAMRDAMVDIQNLARRFGAWVTSSPPVPAFKAGDIWIIVDAHGSDAHTGVCVSDAVDNGDGSWSVDTVEGGQPDGHASSAIGTFTRTWHLVGNRWMLGARFLLGFAAAERMPVPDINDVDAGEPAAAT